MSFICKFLNNSDREHKSYFILQKYTSGNQQCDKML